MANNDIQGVITDPNGNPIQGAKVYLFREDATSTSANSLATATTDANGEYIFTRHPNGTGNVEKWVVTAKYESGSTQYRYSSLWGVDATIAAVPPSLVSHWTFDSSDTNSGTAIDTVGPNNGTISGATTGVSGANQTYTTNEAYSFDGNGDGVDFGRVGDGLEAFSVAAWVNPDFLVGDASILIRDGGTKQVERHWALRIDDSSGTVGLFVSDSANNKIKARSATTIPTGSWSHVVGTMRGTTATIYVDGTAEGSDSNSSYDAQPTSAQPAKAAGANPGGYEYYGGDIDDARFYDKELTSTEVSNLYNNGGI